MINQQVKNIITNLSNLEDNDLALRAWFDCDFKDIYSEWNERTHRHTFVTLSEHATAECYHCDERDPTAGNSRAVSEKKKKLVKFLSADPSF